MSGHSASPRLLGLPWQALAIAAVGVALLLLLSPAYGWHRDELYFVVAGRHPALGYVDQPPLTPLLSAGMVALLGPSPTAVRIVPALVLGAIVVLAGLIARVVSAAAAVEPTAIRTLDAIHLASAALLGEDLEAIVTYDLRLATAAATLGIAAAAPGG